jgi:hypothetical protein
MDLANIRRQGVRCLIAYCLNDACRHQAPIEISDYPDEVEILYFKPRVKCSKCGGRWVDVRRNWKETPRMPEDWQKRPAMPTGEE